MARMFGERLRAARLAAGIDSTNRLALLAGVNQGALSKIERGLKGIGPEYLERLAPVLGLDVSVLRAWALEDELGAEEALKVARALMREHDVPPIPDEGKTRSLGQDPVDSGLAG